MFVIRAKVYDISQYVEKTFGIFSTKEKAQEAIDILVERFRKTEEPDDEELEWMVDDYRSHFTIIPLPNVDNMDFFLKGDLPYF